MPYVNLKVGGSLSLDQRGRIAAAISTVLEQVAGKPPAVTYIHFDETNRHRWVRGETTGAFNAICFPVVELKAAGALTFAQRAAIAAGIEAALKPFTHDGNPPGYLIFEEVSRQSWARGGTMLETPPDA